jgi:hypothetical protein
LVPGHDVVQLQGPLVHGLLSNSRPRSTAAGAGESVSPSTSSAAILVTSSPLGPA